MIMADMRDVFISEDGEYLTYPDGDYATIDEIIHFMSEFPPEFRELLGERTVGIHDRGQVKYRKF
jgi:hypothetical protein